MKQTQISRRNFFKLSLLGASALALPAIGLATVAAAPSQEALAAAQQPQGPAIPQPTFNPITSNTTFGALADISMGWDGTLWGIDAQGAPHIYDALGNTWQQHGQGIDAAAQLGDLLYFFRGTEFVTASQQADLQMSAPKTIAAQWPTLPDSFKLGVVGAGNFNDKGLLLFNGGRFASTDGSIPLTSLTSLTNWPQAPAWKDGVIDGVYCASVGTTVILMRGSEFVRIDPVARTVTDQPAPLNSLNPFNPFFPATWLASGFDAGTNAGQYQIAFKGTALVIQADSASGPGSPQYIGAFFTKGWPAAWHPVLGHAPSGRDGNLWSVLPKAQGSYIMQHNGDAWTQQPDQADHVSTGQDGTTMIASAGSIWRYAGNNQFTQLAGLSGLIQVSVGDNNSVWGRDTGNTLHRFNTANNTFTPMPEVGQAVHMAANTDGTLWHAKPSDPNMHRFLADTNSLQPGIPVKQGLVTSVQKVAATGFGAAHCLTQDSAGSTQAYRYDSPYVFKTATPYSSVGGAPILQALGMLYSSSYTTINFFDRVVSFLVAVDAHTGQEISRSASLQEPASIYRDPIFDPVNELVYVGTSHADNQGDTTTPGQLLALDARDLSKVVWSFSTPAGIDGSPALIGNTLFFGDRTSTMYALDVNAARANPTAPQPTQTWLLNSGLSGTFAFTPAMQIDDRFYTVMWILGSLAGGNTEYAAYLCSFSMKANDTPKLYLANIYLNAATLGIFIRPLLGRPILVNGPTGTGPNPQNRQLYLNAGNGVVVMNVDSNFSSAKFSLPAGSTITTHLGWDGEAKQLWFGDNQGTLYGLDLTLKPVGHTPVSIGNGANRYIFSTPVVYTDGRGGKTVFTGLYAYYPSTTPPALYGFDPDSGNLASVPTGATMIGSLSSEVTNGILYVGGAQASQSGAAAFAQIFAIRVDQLPQAARDFIIESQLMQDPDQAATGSGSTDPANPIPPSVARYQTHLTVVDDQKMPRPYEAVKVWADVANTVITVDGKPYTIGPGDAQFAAVKTGVDGSLVIVSNATDVNASALRAWATFMDPYERIVIYPDHEWHGRSTQSVADPSADPNKPDPNKPNLSTAYNYKGTQLFTADEKTQNTPQNVAGAIGQMNKGVNPGAATPHALAGALKTVHASAPGAQYVAYTDLGGMHYAPSNARVARTPTIAQPIGLQLTRAADGTHTYTPLSHSDARTAIDALTGSAWDPANPNAGAASVSGAAETMVIQSTDNIFTDFWNWLVNAVKTLVNKITQIVVSVAEDIVVGIQFIVNGVEKAFKAIVKAVEDVVNAIGSFFLQLEKLIEDMIEALSVLLHFGEIMWTHRWLAAQFETQVAGLAAIIKAQVKPAVDGFVQRGETAVKGFFDTLRGELGQSDQLNNLKGSGATPHTTFTAGPRGGAPSSHAAECSWGLQKMKSGAPSGTASPSSLSASKLAPAGSTADPITDFVSAFLARLSGDGDLSSVFAQLKSDFGNLFNAGSIQQFFTTLLKTLLDILEALVVGALAVAGAFIDGLFAIIDDVIQAILAVANEEIQIPFLTWLYELLFQEKLNFINLFTLVAAIPVTILIRVVEGQYPSALLPPTATQGTASGQPASVAVASKAAQMALAICNGVFMIAYGLVNGIGDADPEAPPFIGRMSAVLGLLTVTFATPSISSANPDTGTWTLFGWNLAIATIFFFSLPDFGKADQAVLPYISSLVGLIAVIVAIVQYVEGGSNDVLSNLGFTENISGAIPTMLNAIKVAGEEAAIVVGVFDVVGNMLAGAINIGLAFAITSPEPAMPHRLHVPMLHHTPVWPMAQS